MITTDDVKIENNLRQYRDDNFKKKGCISRFGRLVYLKAIWLSFNPYFYGVVNFMERKGWLDRFSKYYDEEEIYFPKDWDRLPAPIEAKVGLAQLKKYDAIVKRRTENSLKWKAAFKGQKEISFFPDIEGASYSHCVGRVEDRDSWVKAYHKKGFQLGILIEYNVPEMESYKKYSTKEFPISSDFSKHMVNFPIHTEVPLLSKEDLRNIAKIHYSALANDILPALGIRYLMRFYKYLNKSKHEDILVQRNPMNEILSVLIISNKVHTLFSRTLKNTFCSFVFYSAINFFLSSRFRKSFYQVFKAVILNNDKLEELNPEIVYIFTNPSLQNQRLGSKLLKEGEHRLRKNGYSHLFVRTIKSNENKAIKFYLKNGYHVTGLSNFAGNEYYVLKICFDGKNKE
jgi:ribosomal protein S18 acetylase RimI-like enzyme